MSKVEHLQFKDAESLAAAAAGEWLNLLDSTHALGKTHCVALSGGRIAKVFFSAVAKQAASKKDLFANVHFFWADERCVPPDDAESNFRVANEFLLNPLGIDRLNIHRIRGEESSEFACVEAEAEICRVAPLNSEGQPMLDLIFLGMGEDGHVASLFPEESPEIRSNNSVYRAVTASKPPPRRITIGYKALALAEQVWVLASGQGKERALRGSLSPSPRTPLGNVIQSRRLTRIFSDFAVG